MLYRVVPWLYSVPQNIYAIVKDFSVSFYCIYEQILFVILYIKPNFNFSQKFFSESCTFVCNFLRFLRG